MKHTPGPWAVVLTPRCGWGIKDRSRAGLLAFGGMLAASTGSPELGNLESVSNALLISAAPELLALAVAIRKEHDDIEATMAEPVAGPGPWRCDCDLCKAADAAIAKSEGRAV